MSIEADAALALAMSKPDAVTKEDLSVICFTEFATRKWSELTEKQQWKLIEIVDDSVMSPVPQTPTVGYYQRHGG